MITEHSVTIGIKELITMTASEIARKVSDELRTAEIEPLHKRIDEVEARLEKKLAWSSGVFDTFAKLGLVGLCLLEAFHYIKDWLK